MIHPAKVLSFACLVSLGVNFELASAAMESAIAPTEQTSPTPTSPAGVAPYDPQAASQVGIGARGEEVEILQRQLQGLGYYNGPIDGIYGSSTAAGVENFQQDASLPATGSVDLPTWQQLQSPLPAANQELPEPVAVPGATPESNSEPAANVEEDPGLVGADSQPVVEPLPPDGDSEIDPEDVPEDLAAAPNPSGLWIGVALLGLIAALIGVGVAIALWLRLKQLTAELDAADAYPETELQNLPPVTNGSLALGSGQAPRLSRINILDELTADLQSSEPATRHKAIWELGQRGHSAAVQPLVDIFLDADSKERSLILAALSEVGIHTLKPMNRALALSLQDANPEVRKNAIRDLTRLYELVAQVSQLLSHAAQDSSPEVQDTARWAIGQLGQIRLMANPAVNSPPELAPERQPDSPSQLS